MAPIKKICRGQSNNIWHTGFSLGAPKNHSLGLQQKLGSAIEVSRLPMLGPVLGAKGFGSIYLLAVLPVLMSLLIAMTLTLTTAQALLAPRQVCRKKMISFQTTSGLQLSQLEALNNRVKIFRAEEFKLKVELAAAAATENWVAVAGIKARLTVIQEEFQAIRFAQNTILEANSALAQSLTQQLNAEIKKPTSELAAKIKSFAVVKFQYKFSKIQPLAVKPDRLDSSAPIYELAERFSESQSSQAFWNTKIYIHSSSWASRWFRSQINWQDECGATLLKENTKWQSHLIEGSGVKF